MKYLSPSSTVMALAWATPLEQYLGPVQRADGWWVRWARIDPYCASRQGLVISVQEERLKCDPSQLDLTEHPELPPDPIPQPIVVTDALDAPPSSDARDADHAALLRAEQATGARPDRWVNSSTEGWHYLCLLRGHD